MIKAVIFDIDGVLIDSFERNFRLFRDLIKDVRHKKTLTRKEYKTFFHLTAEDTLKASTGIANKKEINRLMENLRGYRHTVPLKIIPNSVQIIKQLADKYKLALVTSRIKSGVWDYLQASNTTGFFKVIVHFGHYKNPKPHPEPLLVACKRLKIKPAEAVYIGDTKADIQSAKAAGIKVILFSQNKITGADAYAKKFLKIPEVIKKLKLP